MPEPRDPNFSKLNIAAGGVIHDALTDHRILRAALHDVVFVIAHAVDRQRAIDVAAQVTTGRVYTILLTDEHLDTVRAGTPHQDVDVLAARLGHQPVGQIKVSGEAEIVQTTEHGRYAVSATRTGDLRLGDVFTAGKFTGRARGLTLFRALADFDAEEGTVEKHVVTRFWDKASPADQANLSSLDACGPDWVVHRVVDRVAFLTRLGLRDLVSPVSS